MEVQALRREIVQAQIRPPIHPKRARLLASQTPQPIDPSTPPPQYDALPNSNAFSDSTRAENGLHHPGNSDCRSATRWWHTKKAIFLVIVIFNVIVLGAVLGGVLGSRRLAHDDHPTFTRGFPNFSTAGPPLDFDTFTSTAIATTSTTTAPSLPASDVVTASIPLVTSGTTWVGPRIMSAVIPWPTQ
ncbi:hypothetical protein NP233_g2532 [Leucocoprinus birnbaumii]|uniref:Uncharacterized protein n=1 Tax=Leucocoprinus birnbaumii TaxID=56174 RepID=A0AAD5W246_9AGAR|nr:hypothetical protein NP233_g2532 [Leucocoprinus birnbaumii]